MHHREVRLLNSKKKKTNVLPELINCMHVEIAAIMICLLWKLILMTIYTTTKKGE